MLKSVLVNDFQRIVEAHVDLDDVTLLVGGNGQGKTSIADAIEFALLGEPPRGGKLETVIRNGGKTAEVTLELADGGPSLTRRRMAKGGAAIIDVDPVAETEFQEAVRARIGDPRAIRSVLRSGTLLDMERADLQRFLIDLTGARFDETAIRAALGDAVIAAATRTGLALPSSIIQFPGLEERAVGTRQEAKRAEKARREDLARLPRPEVDVGERKLTSIERALSSLRIHRDTAATALAATSAEAVTRRRERIKFCGENIQKLEAEADEARASLAGAAPARDVRLVEGELSGKRKEAGKLDAEVSDLDRQIDVRGRAETPREGDEQLAALVNAGAEQIASAERVQKNADAEAAEAERDALRAQKTLKDAPAGGTCAAACEHCAVANAAAARARLAERVEAAEKWAKECRELAASAAGHLASVRKNHLAAKAADERLQNARALVELRERRLRAGLAADGARQAETDLTAELDGARRVAFIRTTIDDKAREALKLRDELARIEASKIPDAPAADAVINLDARIRDEETALRAARARDAIDAAQLVVDTAEARVTDTDLVAVALGRDGARKALVANGAGEFLDACNKALAFYAPEWAVGIDADTFEIVLKQGAGTFPASKLSEGQRLRLRTVLQVAVARLAKIPFVVFDHLGEVDEEGRASLDALIASCRAGGMQVVLIRHGSAPETATVATYGVEDGRARRMGADGFRPVPGEVVHADA